MILERQNFRKSFNSKINGANLLLKPNITIGLNLEVLSISLYFFSCCNSSKFIQSGFSAKTFLPFSNAFI